MKVYQLLANRQPQWQELDVFCRRLESRRLGKMSAEELSRFAALYRAACADLALADAYGLPPGTIQFLHQLVGRAHNQLYRSRALQIRQWADVLLYDVPRQIMRDPCVRAVFVAFWACFLLCLTCAADPQRWPNFAERLLPPAMLDHLESSFQHMKWERGSAEAQVMSSFYIRHNTGIGLQCFAGGLLFLPGIVMTLYNAAVLGTAFGYMARPDLHGGDNFFEFVTAHGPCELTAIVLSSGTGLKLGFAWVATHGYGRLTSLQRAARDAMPIMGAAMVLFFLAAIIEAFLSPSGAPYEFKALVAVVTSGLICGYFVLLGLAVEPTSRNATGTRPGSESA